MKLRVYKILKNTKVEGPESRYCIWTQGCSRHCKGCQNVSTWSHKSGTLIDINTILSDIESQKTIEGVTFLGGEPFEQAEPLGILAENIKKRGLGIVCFSGWYLHELERNPINKKLLNNIDLLIDGPFEIENLDFSRPWCGSTNQNYHFLTNRYNENIFEKYHNKVEVNISKNGTIFMNGIGDFQKISKKMNFITVK